MDATNELIAAWLSPKREIQQALQRCTFLLKQGEGLMIDVPTDLLDTILSDPSVFARSGSFNRVEILCDGKVFSAISTKTALAYLNKEQSTVELLTSEDTPLTVVRMSDNKILHASKGVIITGTRANDMTGRNSKDWWLDDEYRQFIELLDVHGSIHEHRYRALLMSNDQPAWFTVNAKLSTWRGDDVRIVELLDTTPI